jgi:hypothetical protein
MYCRALIKKDIIRSNNNTKQNLFDAAEIKVAQP